MKLKKAQTQIFQCSAHLLNTDKEIDAVINEASYENLKSHFEKTFNQSVQKDRIRYYVGNLAVAGLINKNDDGISIEDGLRIYKKFENGYINVEHYKSDVVGFIASAALSEFGTNKVITEEEARIANKPFNISVCFAVWKDILGDYSTEFIDDSTKKENWNYEMVSLSWELAYDEFIVCTGSKDIGKATIIDTDEGIEKIQEYLSAQGGTGFTPEGLEVYRVLTGEGLVPMGAGLVSHPAGAVKGLEVVDIEAIASMNAEEIFDVIQKNPAFADQIQLAVAKLKPLQLEKESIESSQEKSNIVTKIRMKIKSSKDITDEALASKSVIASDITDFISDELKKGSDEWSEKLKAQEALVESEKVAKETFAKELEDLKKQSEATSAELEALKSEKVQAEAEASFNARMAQLDDEFELTDEDKSVIVAQIKDLDEEAFASWKKSFDVLAKSKNKLVIAEAKENAEKEKSAVREEALAELKTKKVPADVALTPNFSDHYSTEQIDKYRKAFSIGEGVEIK